MSQDIYEQGNRYWLITRTAFNHMTLLVSSRPYLLPSFYRFFGNFSVCREVRSLDSEIMLYRMNTLVPQALGNTEGLREDLNMEEVTYQGAYVRTLTMLVLEELIKRHTKEIDMAFNEGVQKLIMWLIDINYSIKFEKASMPYSDGHRTKVRAW
jgi:hypothetical protein